MKFRTELTVAPGHQITHSDSILTLGSCFSTEIGDRLRHDGFNAVTNPTGTLYNPLSIARTIEVLEQHKLYTEEDIFLNQGLWRSFDHHSSLADADPIKALEKINSAIERGTKALSEATQIFVTFGTAWVYEHRATGSTVCNCHKLPAAEFTRRRLTVDEITECWRPIIDRYPSKHFVFTVSPIRHTADGLHGNQLSKATLLLAIEELGADYFPAYEALVDDLRDYRFYAADMKHPSPVAADYVYDLLAASRFSPETMKLAAERAAVSRAALHRPLPKE